MVGTGAPAAAWLPGGITFQLGVDGISATLVLLTTFLSFIALLFSLQHVRERVRDIAEDLGRRERDGPQGLVRRHVYNRIAKTDPTMHKTLVRSAAVSGSSIASHRAM